MQSVVDRFRLDGRIAVVTGGAGFLGVRHAEAIAQAGGTPVLWDLDVLRAEREAARIRRDYNRCSAARVDITKPDDIRAGLARAVGELSQVDILINNAANDPKVQPGTSAHWTRLEEFQLQIWEKDLAVGLTGAFLCSQIVGSHMAARGRGVILNIASDLALVAPDQRIYRRPELPQLAQPVKPVSYSVVKHGIIGLTRYLATYWAEQGVRVNALSPGGVGGDQPVEFVQRLTQLIPMGRMATEDEYMAAIIFLVSDASSYMTGANVVIDGGRTCW